MCDDISVRHAGVDKEGTLGSCIAVPAQKVAEFPGFWLRTEFRTRLSAASSSPRGTNFHRSPLAVRVRTEVEAA
jgi:hypothetical protein